MRTILVRIDSDSSVGLADQIVNQLRGAVVSGRLQPGERLPSARELAAGLDVNMHTVLRAYALLRDQGLIELRRGRGARVRMDLDIEITELDEQIRSLLAAAASLGMTREELVGHMELVGHVANPENTEKVKT